MKKGREYENLVYQIFSEYFKGFTLKQNDQIPGKQSGISREIDVSIRGKIDDNELLFVVQAKDYKDRKSDINIIGAFSAVIQDIGASKGFLVCASGFAKSNSQYARTLGIELLSVEDIESKKWKARIEIPVIYTTYDINYSIEIPMSMSMMNDLNKISGGKGVTINHEDKFNFSTDGGKTFLHINDHITNLVKQGNVTFTEQRKIIFDPPLRLLKFPTFEFPNATLTTEPKKKLFLKYVIPDEYRGIKDHLNKTFIPTTFKITDVSLTLDDSYTQIDETQIPINPSGFSISVEVTQVG